MEKIVAVIIVILALAYSGWLVFSIMRIRRKFAQSRQAFEAHQAELQEWRERIPLMKTDEERIAAIHQIMGWKPEEGSHEVPLL